MILHPPPRSYRLGFAGLLSHDRLASTMGRRLDDGFHWFRAASPGGIEPIDAVIVGPGGTWTLSMTGERGGFARRNGHWYRWNRSTDSWVPWDPAPITAARLAGRRLNLYLERAGLPAEVEPILMPRMEMTVTSEPGDPLNLVIERDPERVAGLVSAEERLSGSHVDRIVALLDPLQPLPQLAPSTPRG